MVKKMNNFKVYDRVIYHPSILKILDKEQLQYKIIKDAGHTLNSEFSDVTNQEVKGFLLLNKNLSEKEYFADSN